MTSMIARSSQRIRTFSSNDGSCVPIRPLRCACMSTHAHSLPCETRCMSNHTVVGLPQTGTWEIDSRHSTMRFSVIHHAVAYFRAGFHPITGSYDAATRTLTGEVRSADLTVPIEPLRNHLLTADFFDAE